MTKLERVMINGHIKNVHVGDEKKLGLEREAKISSGTVPDQDGRLILKYILKKCN